MPRWEIYDMDWKPEGVALARRPTIIKKKNIVPKTNRGQPGGKFVGRGTQTA